MNLDFDRDLTGQVALVAGTDFAIDLVVAQALAARGATVVWGTSPRPDDERSIDHASWLSAGIHPVSCDLFRDEAVTQLVEETISRHGPIDILVHHLADAAPATAVLGWSATTVLSVSSSFLLTQKVAITCMLPRQRGRIICVTSPWELVGADELARRTCRDGYQAIEYTCRRLAGEWAQFGVSVNHVWVDAGLGEAGPRVSAAGETFWPANGWSLGDAVTLFGSCRGVCLTGHTVSAHIEPRAPLH